MKINGKQYPYGYSRWICDLWKIGVKINMWNFSVMEYKQKLCLDSYLTYFMMGLHPKDAIQMDLNEQ